MGRKAKLVKSILVLSAVLNFVIIGAAYAATTDTVSEQTLVNAGALSVSFDLGTQFMGSFDSEGCSESCTAPNLDFGFGDLTIDNTTGSSTPFALSWNAENMQGTTGKAAAGTGFNYATQLQGQDDSGGSITFTAGSVGTENVALSATGTSYNFPGSGASGTTSGDVDLLTGSGAVFNLVMTIDPIIVVQYGGQLPGLYSGDVTFTII